VAITGETEAINRDDSIENMAGPASAANAANASTIRIGARRHYPGRLRRTDDVGMVRLSDRPRPANQTIRLHDSAAPGINRR